MLGQNVSIDSCTTLDNLGAVGAGNFFQLGLIITITIYIFLSVFNGNGILSASRSGGAAPRQGSVR